MRRPSDRATAAPRISPATGSITPPRTRTTRIRIWAATASGITSTRPTSLARPDSSPASRPRLPWAITAHGSTHRRTNRRQNRCLSRLEESVKIWDYLDITPTHFRDNYANTGLVDVAIHPEFPLTMFTYGREAVHTNNWDAVMRKCRGIIFDTVTEEIIARPFEKFFNMGTADMPETDPNTWLCGVAEPEVWEKMDGFMCTMYSYYGKSYIASKGSFDSIHAKWATAQVNANWQWPLGYTPMFEGICSSIRIVVDYEKFEGLVLLALVNNETGEELNRTSLQVWAKKNGVTTPTIYDLSWKDARMASLDKTVENFEGYVLVWWRAGGER